MADTAAEEAELCRWGVWTPSGSVTPREYLASSPAADQVRARLDVLLKQPERYGALIRAFAEYLDLDLDLDLDAERHPRRPAALAAGERQSAPQAVQGAPQAMTDGENADGHGEQRAVPAGEHLNSSARGERHRAVLTPPVAAILRAARGRAGWSVRQAAGHLHLAVGMVSMMESGSRAPSLQVAERLVEVLQLSESEAEQLLREAVPTGRDSGHAANGS